MLKIGIIGWGYWGRNYAKYFDSSVDARLDTVCDIRPDMLAEAKRVNPQINTTNDIRTLLTAGLDGIILVSPASLHANLALPFIDAGIPILIEKPLANSLKSAILLKNHAIKKHAKVLVGHTFLYNQAVRYLKCEIAKNELGKLYYLEFRRQSYGPVRDDVNIIWDFAPHDIAIANYLLGALPQTVFARAEKFSRHAQEDIAVILLTYPGNIMVNINVGWLYPIKIRSLTVLGDKKMATFEDNNLVEPVKVYDMSLNYPREEDPSGASFRLGDVHIPRIIPVDPLATQLRHFVLYIQGKEKPISDIRQGVDVVSILDALQESMRTAKEINFQKWLRKY